LLSEEKTETKAKQTKQSGDQAPRKTHGERALAKVRAAKRGQREVSDPDERARLSLAEAQVLALLDVAEALAGSSPSKGRKE
jgi:hypothetical protein